MERGGFGWSIESTRRERPRMSERRINSWGLVGYQEVLG